MPEPHQPRERPIPCARCRRPTGNLRLCDDCLPASRGGLRAGRQRANALRALRLLEAYANPLRAGLPLSSTEAEATRRAAQLLRATP